MDIKFNVFTADDSSFDTIAAFIYHLSKEGLMADRITIQDIADALGVSRNTVSKAINNTGILADATREKVLKKLWKWDINNFPMLQR